MNFGAVMLAVSGVVFLFGLGMLCDCPGWFAISAVFAGLAVWKGKGVIGLCALLLFAAAVGLTAVRGVAEYRIASQIQNMRLNTMPMVGTNGAGTSAARTDGE